MTSLRDKQLCKARVLEWADKLDVNIRSLSVRPMRNKWASCSTGGNVNFNDELLAFDRDVADYVIVHEMLHFFVREGVQWRELRAAAGRACGSTLRRRLDGWSATALLRRVHVALIRLVRAGPEPETAPWDVVIDSCSVRAKRGGDLTGPSPTDRGKQGTKYHIATTGDGVPVACAATAANVNDTLLFERLFLFAGTAVG